MLWSRYFLVRNTNGGDGSGRNAREDGKNTQSRLDGRPFNEQIRQSVSQSVSVVSQLSFHYPWTGSERCSRYPYSVKNLKDKIEKSEGDNNNKPPSYLTCVKPTDSDRIRPKDGCKAELQSSRSDSTNSKCETKGKQYHHTPIKVIIVTQREYLLTTKYLLIYYVPLERFLFSSPLKDG